jgi:hypothetical protein
VTVEVSTAVGSLSFDKSLGTITDLDFRWQGRHLTPLHRAPWLDEPAVQDDTALLPVERRLTGDYFCAPFGLSDLEAAPAHGWSANSPWTVDLCDRGRIDATLRRLVLGARITKRQTLADKAPLLYQEHWIEGGEGDLTVAHHPMVRIAGIGRFDCSAKRMLIAADPPLEPGRNRLAAGGVAQDLQAFPTADGTIVDLGRLPIGDAHEDFVTLIEAPDHAIGWSAVLRDVENDIVLVLKDPRVLPVTMLWHSNGGRDYPPWNGRHTGVLGIEDGCAAGASGHRGALEPNPVSSTGVPTALRLGRGVVHRVAHVIGAVARPPSWDHVRDIRIDAGQLVIDGPPDHPPLILPFHGDFFPPKHQAAGGRRPA